MYVLGDMYNSFRFVDTCRLCGSKDLEAVLSLNPSPLGDQYLPIGSGAKLTNLVPFGIRRCEECKNFQTETAISRDHYRHCLTRPASVNTVLSKAYESSVEGLIELSEFSANDLMLEIGTNDGLFASFFAKRGLRCLGVDPAANLIRSANDLGVTTICDFFGSAIAAEIASSHGNAKLIVANFVLANVDDLDDFVDGIKQVLSPDGVFVIETNDVSSIAKKFLVETLVHEHLSYFSIMSLKKFFEKHELRVFDAVHVESKGGSLRLYVSHDQARYETRARVETAVLEEAGCLSSIELWEKFGRVFALARESANEFCERNFRSGIAGYGTSDGATTLLYQLGIGEFIKVLIDDDPYRQNLESPGLGIPTVGKERVFTSPPKAESCLVLAPQYAQKIFDNNLTARNLGVSFFEIWPLTKLI